MTDTTFATPAEAEAAFYHAFEMADLNAMMAVWESGDDNVCIHPLGPCLTGGTQIRAGWQQIFKAPVRLHFHISAAHCFITDGLAVHIVYEQITVVGADEQPQLLITTNSYRRTPSGWRMVLHHASPGGDPPKAQGTLH